MDYTIEDLEVSMTETEPHKILKGKALAAKLRAANQESILINRNARIEFLSETEADAAKSFSELCSLLDTSLAFSTKIASSLEEKQNTTSTASAVDKDLNLRLFTGGNLRDYQKSGAAWMVKLRKQGLNGILADEMGLGKTAQSIAMICHLVASGVKGPFLVVGPLSTLKNWESEFHRFSPSLPVLLLHGNKRTRQQIIGNIKIKHKLKGEPTKSIYPVVITPYHILSSDIMSLERIKWSYLVFDEASVIKNNQTRIYRNVSSLCVSGKLLLTGTPLQNNIRELFNLLHIILPNVFHDYRLFEGWLEELDAHREEGSFGDGDSVQLVSTMHTILAPFFLRRTKQSVKIDLPQKKHIVVYCPMTKLQQRYYEAILSAREKTGSGKQTIEVFEDGKRPRRSCRTASFAGYEDSPSKRRKSETKPVTSGRGVRLSNGESSESDLRSEIDQKNGSASPPYLDNTDESFDDLFDGNLADIKFNSTTMINVLMALRKVVAHPWLVHFNRSWGNHYPADRDAILKRSGKMQVFHILLQELLKNNHKLLVFSTFTRVLDIVSLYLECSGIEHFYLSGVTMLDDRQAYINEFNQPDSIEKVFLLSTRAGGMGINLTGADTVIFFDTDWNPQIDLQAADRCHRIGQTQRVVIYRLIGKETIDERILEVATNKRRLEKLVMECGNFEKVSTLKDLNKNDLLRVLGNVDWDAALDGDLLDPSRLIALANRDLVFNNPDSIDVA